MIIYLSIIMISNVINIIIGVYIKIIVNIIII
jgi:hypothetical protein